MTEDERDIADFLQRRAERMRHRDQPKLKTAYPVGSPDYRSRGGYVAPPDVQFEKPKSPSDGPRRQCPVCGGWTDARADHCKFCNELF